MRREVSLEASLSQAIAVGPRGLASLQSHTVWGALPCSASFASLAARRNLNRFQAQGSKNSSNDA